MTNLAKVEEQAKFESQLAVAKQIKAEFVFEIQQNHFSVVDAIEKVVYVKNYAAVWDTISRQRAWRCFEMLAKMKKRTPLKK